MGDLAGWPYWKVVSITGQSGAGIDYQIELEIGDSAGGDFHLEGHCTNFPQDIRITDDDGTTLLDYWIEDLTADPIIVHVKVDDDLGSNQDIRVYYGKSGETTFSDIRATMLDGDDFSGSSLDTGIWDKQYCNDGVSGGILTLDTFLSTGGRFAGGILGKRLISTPFVCECRRKSVYASDGSHSGLSNFHDVRNDDSTYCDLTYNSNISGYNLNEGSVSYVASGFSWLAGTYYTLKLVHIGSQIRYYRDDSEYSGSPATSNIPDEDMYMVIGGDADYSPTINVDWIFVRKYNSPEPAFSSAGAEQTPPIGAIMNQFQRANIGADLYNGVFA